jgi:hypothetical protein
MTPSVSKLLVEEKRIMPSSLFFSVQMLFKKKKHTYYSYVAAPYMNAAPWISGSSGGAKLREELVATTTS